MKIFLDFDDTLFDRQRFTHEIFSSFKEVSVEDLEAYYKEYRLVAPFTVDGWCKFLAMRGVQSERLAQIFTRERDRAEAYLFPDTLAFLQALKDLNYELFILSLDADPVNWQRPKILASGIANFFKEIEIAQSNKCEHLKSLTPGEYFVFIDDKTSEVQAIKKAFPESLALEHARGTPLAQHLSAIKTYATHLA